MNNYFLLEYPSEYMPEIRIITESELKKKNKNFNFSVFKKHAKLIEKLDKIKRDDPKSMIATLEEKINNTAKINNMKFIEYLFGRKHGLTFKIVNSDYKDDDSIKIIKEGVALKKEDSKMRFNSIKISYINPILRKEYEMIRPDLCNKENIFYNLKISILIKLIDYLKIGGRFFIHVFDFCTLDSINFLYLLSLLFDKVLILKGNIIYCVGFQGEKRISKEKLESLYNKSFVMDPMYKLDKLLEYLKKYYEYRNKMIKILLDKKYKIFTEKYLENYVQCMIEKDVNFRYMELVMNSFNNIFGVKRERKYLIEMVKSMKKSTIKELENVLDRKELNKVLEIGYGLGVYADVMIKSKSMLISIGNKIGMNNEKDNKLFHLYEDDVIVSLQEIEKKYGKDFFDIVMIDKCESFDQYMVQMYYIKKLLKMNGYIIFDNMFSTGYFKMIDYMKSNYQDLKMIVNKNGIYIFKKIEEKILDCEDYYAF